MFSPDGRRLSLGSLLVRPMAPLLAIGVAGTMLAPAGEASTARPVRVMTRNLYIGANLDPATRATSVPQLMAAVAHIYSVVQRTDFPQRAKALAREIADADPVLLGLQEAATWYSGTLGDPSPAATVEYDFIASLRHELAAIGTPYDVVRVQREADLEAPAGAPYFRDIRVAGNDAILVKAGTDGVALTNARSGHFASRLTITNGLGQPTVVDRGWLSVDAVVNKRSFRFVNTHLEAFSAGVRLAQARELLAPDGPVGSAPGPVVLVGDLNSSPELPVPENRLAFQALLDAGLVDTWAALHPGDPGFTAGFNELLTDPSAEATLEHRVDHVMTTPAVGLRSSRRYGTDPDNRTVDGMWPSDHAGVAAVLNP